MQSTAHPTSPATTSPAMQELPALHSVIRDRLLSYESFASLDAALQRSIVLTFYPVVIGAIRKAGEKPIVNDLSTSLAIDAMTIRLYDSFGGAIHQVNADNAFIILARCVEETKKRFSVKLNEENDATIRPNCDKRCLKCRQKQVHFHAVQTRASDEASTIFYECLLCGKKWSGD